MKLDEQIVVQVVSIYLTQPLSLLNSTSIGHIQLELQLLTFEVKLKVISSLLATSTHSLLDL